MFKVYLPLAVILFQKLSYGTQGKMISETGLNLSISYIISMKLSPTFVYPDGDVR